MTESGLSATSVIGSQNETRYWMHWNLGIRQRLLPWLGCKRRDMNVSFQIPTKADFTSKSLNRSWVNMPGISCSPPRDTDGQGHVCLEKFLLPMFAGFETTVFHCLSHGRDQKPFEQENCISNYIITSYQYEMSMTDTDIG